MFCPLHQNTPTLKYCIRSHFCLKCFFILKNQRSKYMHISTVSRNGGKGLCRCKIFVSEYLGYSLHNIPDRNLYAPVEINDMSSVICFTSLGDNYPSSILNAERRLIDLLIDWSIGFGLTSSICHGNNLFEIIDWRVITIDIPCCTSKHFFLAGTVRLAHTAPAAIISEILHTTSKESPIYTWGYF